MYGDQHKRIIMSFEVLVTSWGIMIRFRGSHSQALCMANSPNYQPHIDSLGAIAVLSVVFYYYGLGFFGGGFVGEDMFFVIAGYLICRLTLNEVNDSGDFDFKRFYIRRVRRLFPTLAFALVFSFVGATLLLSPQPFQSYGQSLAVAVLSVSNIHFWMNSGCSDASLFYLTPFRVFELALSGSAIFFARLIPNKQVVEEGK
jgi:peptidoglycan/LPS O-acetylase OafA/YrhL